MTKHTITKSGSTDGVDSYGLSLASIASVAINVSQTGDFDGNSNNVWIGNQNGISFSPAWSVISADFNVRPGGLRDGNFVTFGNPDPDDLVVVGGNRNLVRNQSSVDASQSARTPRIGDHNGTSNIVLIGNANGVDVVFGGPMFGAGPTLPVSTNSSPNSVPVGAAGGHLAISFKSIRIDVSGSGNNDGNNNTVLIGNRNGIGYGGTAAGASFVIAGDVGSHDGDNNTVVDGNNNGVTISLSAGGALPGAGSGTVTSGAAPPDPHALLDSAGVWLGVSPQCLLQNPGAAFAGTALACLTPTSLTFEAAQISVTDSGNNDGNCNLVAIGNENGITGGGSVGRSPAAQPGSLSVGSDDGNGNLVEIGNANGVNLYLAPSYGTAAAGVTAHSGGNTFIPASITFETIGISVRGSGNNDGNGNAVLAGDGNGAAGMLPGRSAGGSLLIGSQDGNLNTVGIGNGNGVNVYLGSTGGVVIGALSGVAHGYWMQDGLGDAFLAATQQEIMRDFASCLPRLSSQSGMNLTFETVNIVASNSGIQDGGGNALAFGIAGGGAGAAVRTSGVLAAGGAIAVGSYNGDNNLVAIGNGNGVNILA